MDMEWQSHWAWVFFVPFPNVTTLNIYPPPPWIFAIVYLFSWPIEDKLLGLAHQGPHSNANKSGR